jgi:hypothetical protein
MVMFNSYVKLPEGKSTAPPSIFVRNHDANIIDDSP